MTPQKLTMQKHSAYIGVGANIGRRRRNCQAGIDLLTGSGLAVLTCRSVFYRTEPVDYKDQDWFANAVIGIETSMDPWQLLTRLKSIEQQVGRRGDALRFGPRELDMDILLYDELVVDSPPLIIPHPRMHKRRFVLQPICDIAPSIVHPVLKQTMRQLLDALDQCEQKVIEYQCAY